MNTTWLPQSLAYTGAELRSFWIRSQTGLVGDAIVAFAGEARVSDHMVDLEDREKKDFIYSPLMLHFIVEHFHMPLDEAVVRQHLLMASIGEVLTQMVPSLAVNRIGDDLYFEKRKLSVSIATLSPMSALMHIGLNIRTEGTPVPTAGLHEWNVDVRHLAEQVMQRYQSECASIGQALVKVLPVT